MYHKQLKAKIGIVEPKSIPKLSSKYKGYSAKSVLKSDEYMSLLHFLHDVRTQIIEEETRKFIERKKRFYPKDG